MSWFPCEWEGYQCTPMCFDFYDDILRDLDQSSLVESVRNGQLIGRDYSTNYGALNGQSSTSTSTRIAFRLKSETESLNDGFRWRKYGKKMVKNSPNPRNYYKCLREDCQVKKRVERDPEDAEYVIVTYDGVHNHPTPN